MEVWYLLDAQGRVVAEKTHDANGDISGEGHSEYDGALLVRTWRDSENPIHQHWETSYEYDAGGNLIETREEDGFREVYSYDCW